MPDRLQLRRLSSGSSARIALVAFPYSGARHDCYDSWAAALQGIDLFVHPLPRACRDASDFDEYLTAAALEIARLPHAKLALFGHSVGALLAHACASRLDGQRRALAKLFVSGMPAPPDHEPLTVVPTLDDATFLQIMVSAGVLGRVPSRAGGQAMVAELLRADMRVLAWYRPELVQKLNAPITAYAGDADPIFASSRLQGWQRHSHRTLRIAQFAGHHMWFRAHAQPLLSDIQRSLLAFPSRSSQLAPTLAE